MPSLTNRWIPNGSIDITVPVVDWDWFDAAVAFLLSVNELDVFRLLFFMTGKPPELSRFVGRSVLIVSFSVWC